MKKYIAILLIIVMALSLTACQETPEEVIVVKKDMERMIEQAGSEENGSKLSNLGIPKDRYTFNSEAAEGKLQIYVDANIRTPDTDKLPIRKASIGVFSQEIVTGIFNYLFYGEETFDRSGIRLTKADYERMILDYQQILANGSYIENNQTEKEILALIEAAEKSYKTAPESSNEPLVSDGTMFRYELHMDSNPDTGEPQDYNAEYALLSVETEDGNRQLSVSTPLSSDRNDIIKSGMNNSLRYSVLDAPAYTTKGMQRTDGVSLPTQVQEKLTISFAEAQALCDGFFNTAGVKNDFCLSASFLVDDKGTGLADGKWVNGQYVEGPKAPAENYAYQFYYSRKTNDIPLATYMRDGGNGSEGFSVPWMYEYICFTVDNSGIVSATWANPIDVGDVVQENATLKTFDEIISVFESMVKVTYEAMLSTQYSSDYTIQVNIDDIELCLLRVREQNSDDTAGLLVPAWVFYGHNLAAGPTGDISYDFLGGVSKSWPEAPIILLAINAIDGSIIDLDKGY